MTSSQPKRNLAVLIPALVVAAGAVAATAHGAFEVAVAAHVPPGIAWLYPVILDGLALVAYASTHRLSKAGTVYAWLVVILAAGLSGLAQATYLASGPALDTSPVLRFGVGAWPAIAGAVAAHLVYLLSSVTQEAAESPVGQAVPSAAPPVPPTRETDRDTDRETWRPRLVADLVNDLEAPLDADVQPPSPALQVSTSSPLQASSSTLQPAPGHAAADVQDDLEVELENRVREIVANRGGRSQVMEELGVSEHKAKLLLRAVRPAVNGARR